MTHLRIASSLPGDLEELVRSTIGCCLAVHRALGPGLLERVYPRAVSRELSCRGIAHSTEKTIPIWYRDEVICRQRIDIFVDERLVLVE